MVGRRLAAWPATAENVSPGRLLPRMSHLAGASRGPGGGTFVVNTAAAADTARHVVRNLKYINLGKFQAENQEILQF